VLDGADDAAHLAGHEDAERGRRGRRRHRGYASAYRLRDRACIGVAIALVDAEGVTVAGDWEAHLSLALGVRAVKAGRSVYFTPLSSALASVLTRSHGALVISCIDELEEQIASAGATTGR
jgi:hypothetical protein